MSSNTRLVHAELSKLRLTPTSWWLFAAALAVVAGAVSATLATTAVTSTAELRSLLSFAGAGGLVALIAGVVGAGGEYRYRTAVAAALITPHRWRTVLAQTTACLLAGALLGVACTALTLTIALPWLAFTGKNPPLPVGILTAGALGAIAYTALSAALGAGIGTLTRSQVLAAALVLGLVGIIDPSLSALFADYAKFSLSGLGSAMSGDPGGTPPYAVLLPAWQAAISYLTYTVALLIAATATATHHELQ